MTSTDEIKAEIDRNNLLINEEIVNTLKDKDFYVPFSAMGSCLMSLFIGNRLLQNRPLKRPVLFRYGLALLGAITAQIGALWLQRDYFDLDPEGKVLAELKVKGNELKEIENENSDE